MREVDVGVCWPSSKNVAAGWGDIWTSIRIAGLQPVGSIEESVADTLETLNVHIWEMNQLLAKHLTPSSPWPRFRPAPTALAYPSTMADDLWDHKGPHRGDVLLRHLRDLDLSRRRESRGLNYVEIGTNQGFLAQWLAAHTSGLPLTMHLVDCYEDCESGWGCPPVSSVVDTLKRVGLHDCDEISDEGILVHSRPDVMLCGPGGIKVKFLKGDSHKVAELVALSSVDLIFVDAGKIYPRVKGDIDKWWPTLRKGGVMAGQGFRYKVGDVTVAVARSFPAADVFLDSDTSWWTRKL